MTAWRSRAHMFSTFLLLSASLLRVTVVLKILHTALWTSNKSWSYSDIYHIFLLASPSHCDCVLSTNCKKASFFLQTQVGVVKFGAVIGLV